MTTSDLIAAAHRSGFEVSNNQLKRWRREGVIPRPEAQARRGHAGVGQVYPPGTLDQLLVVCRLRAGAWRLDELRIRLWTEGHWVDETVLRDTLARVLDDGCAPTRGYLQRADGHPEEAAHITVQDLREQTEFRHPTARLLVRRVGGDREDFFTVAHALLWLFYGGDPEWETHDVGLDDPATGEHAPEASPRELLDRALGVDRALTIRLHTGPLLSRRPDIPGLMRELRDTDAVNIFTPGDAIREASIEQLQRARDQLRVATDLLPTAVAALEVLYGRDAGGLRGLLPLSQRDNAWLQAAAMRLFLRLPRLRLDDNLKELFESLADVPREVVSG